MSSRTATRLAAALWIAAAVATAAARYFEASVPPAAEADAPGPRYLYFIVVIAASTTGALLAARRPGNPIGWLLSATGLSLAVLGFLQWYGIDVISGGGPFPMALTLALMVGDALWLPTIGILLLFIPLIFPDGRLLSRRWRHVIWVALVAMTLATIGLALDPQNGGPFPDPLATPGAHHLSQVMASVGFLTLMACLVAGVASLVIRYRRADDEQRHQLKWFATAVTLMVVMFVIDGILTQGQPVMDALAILGQAGVPIAITIAILKYRLYDIDAFISRSLVYGALAALITAVYVAIVVGFGTLVGSGRQANLALSILATALVAVGFQPVRDRLQRLANRLVYGRRSTPYEVIAEFSHRMAGTLSVGDVLPRIAAAAAQGVSARSARARLFLSDGTERSSIWPEATAPTHFDRVLDVVENGERIGEIAVAKRAGDPLTPVEEDLLGDLATQAGLALHNARLTLELESRLAQISTQTAEISASRQRLVTAQDSERRRLEQTLHDGVRRDLAGIAADLETARRQVNDDPGGAAAMLDALTVRATATLDRLRDVARGIFPPLLVDQGVVRALEAHVRKSSINAEVSADVTVADARFEPQLEATIYFCCVEALPRIGGGEADVPSTVRLHSRDGCLEFSVSPAANATEETQMMRDRVEALGGRLSVEHDGRGRTILVGRVPSIDSAHTLMAATA